MKKNIVIAVLAVLVLCAFSTERQSQSGGWTEIGSKNQCTLYYRVHNGNAIYWSVCQCFSSGCPNTSSIAK